MNEFTSSAPRAAATTPAPRGRPKNPRGPHRELGEGASAEAKRLAAAILEVLTGARTPTQAAQALGLSLPRYDVLEVRALQGMLAACEPRPLGRGPSPGSALVALQRACAQLRRACSRQQALVRAAQRSLGLAPAARGPERHGKKRRRRPTVRALRAAAQRTPEAREPAAAETAAAPPGDTSVWEDGGSRRGARGRLPFQEEHGMRGRWPVGPESIDQLVGTDEKKERLKAILDTLSGRVRLLEACAQLGVGETRFQQLREVALQAAWTVLEPRPAGRPSRTVTAEAERIRALEQRVRQLEQAVHEAQVREEIALILPHRQRTDDGPTAVAEKQSRPRAVRIHKPR